MQVARLVSLSCKPRSLPPTFRISPLPSNFPASSPTPTPGIPASRGGRSLLASSRSYATQSSSKEKDSESSQPTKGLRNEKIPFSSVRVIDPVTRSLSEPTSLRYLISQIDIKTHFYTLVTDNPSPLVKLMSRKEDYQQKLESKRQKRERMQNTAELKEIQMTWGVEKGDLKHKLGKAMKELRNKNLINIILAKKKNVDPPSPAERDRLVQAILDILKDDAKERRPRTSTPVFTILHLGPLTSGSAAAPSDE